MNKVFQKTCSQSHFVGKMIFYKISGNKDKIQIEKKRERERKRVSVKLELVASGI